MPRSRCSRPETPCSWQTRKANRVVRYTTPANFTPVAEQPSPKIEGVVGQADLFSGKANRGGTEPGPTVCPRRSAGQSISSGNIWVVDTNDDRVLSYPANGSFAIFRWGEYCGRPDGFSIQ